MGGQSLQNFLDLETIRLNSTLIDPCGTGFTNRFACFLNAPKFENLKPNSWLEYQVMSVDCPGIGLKYQEFDLNGIKRFSFDLRDEQNLKIVFFDNAELIVRRFFYNWMDYMVKIRKNSVLRYYPNEVAASQMIVIPLDGEGKGQYGDIFENVCPVKIEDLNYNYREESPEILTCSVEFVYQYHRIGNFKENITSHASGKMNNNQINRDRQIFNNKN